MSPAEIVCFAKVRLRDGTEIKAMVEPGAQPPLSRQKLLEMILAGSLLLEEFEARLEEKSRLTRRSQLLRERMEDAIQREDYARSVVASRPVLPTVEEFEK